MTTVLFANNYPVSGARRGVKEGVYPDHHLFGMGSPPAHHRVIDLEVSGVFRSWGDPGQQRDAFRNRPGVLFAANATPVRTILLMRRSGLWRSPVVAVVHEVPGRGQGRSVARAHAQLLKGADRIISMCHVTKRGLVDSLGLDPGRIAVGSWGPDASFQPFLDAPSAFDGPVVSMGKSNRDVATALKALEHIGRPGRVYVRDPSEYVRPPSVEFVDAVPPPKESGAPSSYEYVMADLAAAALVLIPLPADATALQGLTELDDALACGKPVVMSHVPYIDLDIEAEGVGLWAEPGNWRDMAEKVEFILADPHRYAAMSARAREVVRTKWNSEIFARQVWDVMADLT